ncbi:MAG: 1,2-phenylacetyl-CoA epoxidase subunit PaaC [Pseudomonadota bacterium]
MDGQTQQDLFEYALRLGDDALTLGHRISEWTAHAPFLEEDIALGNIGLDFVGRARLLLTYAGEVENLGRDEDQLAYLRDIRQYRNLLICELPIGNFADTMARQLLVDAFELPYFQALSQSADRTLAGIAGKAVKEAQYHLRHSSGWVIRLGDGTEESHGKMADALSKVWGYGPEMFITDELEQRLVDAGIAVQREELRQGWEAQLEKVLAEATLAVPDVSWQVDGGRRGEHTEYLGHMLAEMQFMQRAYPGLQW